MGADPALPMRDGTSGHSLMMAVSRCRLSPTRRRCRRLPARVEMQTQALLVKSAIQAPLFYAVALIGRRARSAAPTARGFSDSERSEHGMPIAAIRLARSGASRVLSVASMGCRPSAYAHARTGHRGARSRVMVLHLR